MIEDAIPDIAAHHVPVCELFLNSFSEYSGEIFDCLMARLLETGLSVYSVHPMSTQFEPQLFSLHPRQRGDAWKIYETVLQAGKQLGATHYVMHGPAHLSGAAKNLEMDRIAPIFRDLCALAKSYDIQLTLENVSWCVFCRPSFGAELQQRLDRVLQYTLDVKQALRSGFDPLDFIDAVGDNIVNLHLCDAATRDERFCLCMPGLGDYDFSKLASALIQRGYAGPAFIEVYSDMYRELPELYESYESMQRIFSSVKA